MQQLIDKLNERAGTDLVRFLSEDLSGSELNSLLLEVFERRASAEHPTSVLRQYTSNRFVKPSNLDPLRLKALELQALQVLARQRFQPVELSPLSPFGTCSAMGAVSQKKIVTAGRGTEVLSDASNALALFTASSKKKTSGTLRYAAATRHVRAALMQGKGFTPHFTIACWVSAGRDTGSFAFETEEMINHFTACETVLKQLFNVSILRFRLLQREGYGVGGPALLEKIEEAAAGRWNISFVHHPPSNNYYTGLQFKAIVAVEGQEVEIADGGFVDWTQQLLQDKKERYLISGLGLEHLFRLLNPAL